MAGKQDLLPFREVIQAIARLHGASNIRIFGSYARGEARPDSDLDLLVDMAPDRSLLDTIAMVQDLQEALGKKVDVVTESALHRLLRAKIMREALPL